MHLLSSSHTLPSLSPSVLCLANLFLSTLFVLPTHGAVFNAKKFFLYIDKSCSDLNAINNAGDEVNGLIEAGQDAFNWTPLREATFAAYFGKLSGTATLDQNSGVPQLQFKKLGNGMGSGKYSLYCDGSAMTWVTTWQEGKNKGKPFDKYKGRWFISPDRRAGNLEEFYIDGTQRDDFCKSDDSKKSILGASSPGKPFVILCPDAFSVPKHDSLLAIKDTKQSDGTRLDSMITTGTVMFHEFTHAIIKTNARNPEIYGAFGCITAAATQVSSVRQNAETFTFFAMASYLEKNAWVLGFAQDLANYGPQKKKGSGQPPVTTPPAVRLRRRRSRKAGRTPTATVSSSDTDDPSTPHKSSH